MKAFLRILDPSDNSTGGGAASAIAGAMAASLVAMVARLSKGRGQEDEFYEKMNQMALNLAGELMRGAERDSLAFDCVMEAYRMPKSTPGEVGERKRAISRSLEEAARIPLENAKLCAQVLDLCKLLERFSNPNAQSDLMCGKILAAAAIKGCLENVKINLKNLEDESKFRGIGEALAELERLVLE